MSLRQRGQRASESTNEGGSGGVYNTSPSSSGGGGYGYGASPPSAASSGGGVAVNNANPYGGGGGYYGASPTSASSTGGGGYNTSPGGGVTAAVSSTNTYGAATTPRAYPNTSAGYGGAAYNNSNNNPAVASPYASSNMSGYSAAPAYNAGGYGGASSSSGSPMAYNTNNAAAYGNTVTAGAGYGGYSNSGGSTTGSSASTNPFHASSKKKSSFNLGSITNNILPLLLGLTICTLTATTIHFRRSMLQTQTQIELSKETIQTHHKRSTQRFQSNREKLDQEKANLMESNERIKGQITKLSQLHKELSDKNSHFLQSLNAQEVGKQSIMKKIDHMKYKLEDMVDELEKYTSMLNGKVEVEEYSKKRERALWDVVGRLESKIGRESWREAEEWFGPGPHKVEIDLEYPKVNTADAPSTWPRTRNKIILEMAPLDLMPHSVNLFLQQVHHGLWDGNELTANPEHIMSFGYHRASAHEGFVDKALETVSFQEYSNKYPHVQWTVGFMGRPSGPDFYINKKDNSVAHGPGGQANFDDMHNEADPCFAKVVEGLDVLNEINDIPVDKQHGYELSYPVKIVSARVMAQRNNNSFDDHQGGAGGGGGGSYEGVQHGRKFNGEDKIMPQPIDETPHTY
eukprot:scaffold37_cov138-Skeletonema_marinoi.AAC.5